MHAPEYPFLGNKLDKRLARGVGIYPLDEATKNMIFGTEIAIKLKISEKLTKYLWKKRRIVTSAHVYLNEILFGFWWNAVKNKFFEWV